MPRPEACVSSSFVLVLLTCTYYFPILFNRRDAGVEGIFRLDSSATNERIRMACVESLLNRLDDGCNSKIWNQTS